MRRIFILLLVIFMISCGKTKVDMIVFSGHVYTVDNQFSMAEAFAIKDGKFVAVGSNRQINRRYHATKILDVAGRSIYPGLIDGHCHFVGYSETKARYADLTGCTSFEEVMDRLEKHNAG
ncbi:MAG: hypothetical protein SPK72_06305, partial [Bacteroidales bacterium]|nr:hypothetical protein [Bacteroidales bacterium]